MATGVGFGFDTSFLKNLELADKRMEELMKKSNSLALSVTSAFQKMSSGGVLPFVKELETRLHALQNVEFTIGDSADKDLKKLKESTASAIESINTLLGTLYKSQGYRSEVESEKLAAMKKANTAYYDYIMDKIREEVTESKKAGAEILAQEQAYYAQRQAMYNKVFDAETDDERYERWLMQKHHEAKEHKRIEDEKTQATAEAIRKQNEAFAEQARKEAEIKQQNAAAASNSEKARQSYIETVKMYDQMFDEIDKKEQQYAAERDKRNEQEKKSKLKQLDEQIRAHQEYQERQRKIEEEAEKAREKAYKERAGSNRKQNEAYNTSYEGAIDFSGRANSINREKKAIEYLTAARNSLSKSDANYTQKLETLNKAIHDHERSIKKAENASRGLQAQHSRLMNTSAQLQRRIAMIFSVSQINNYIRQLVKVRAQLELQRKSIEIIIQDKYAADKLWNQTIQLALKSPFQVNQLITYTKQLAAYRIETDKLHDTTKRLADVSAGVGVDMQRLILAYGQVRAASFLRATEVRQFTEAGIPLLEELASQFSKVEGKTVSVAEVMERVSKRMVVFSDVEQVFKRMTDESGVFYKMQEQQSKTLAGRISNLKDKITLMMNDIGASNQGIIGGFLGVAETMAENWQLSGAAISTVVTSVAALGAKNLWASITSKGEDLVELSEQAEGFAGGIARVRVGLIALSKAAMAHPFLALAAAIVAVGTAIYMYYQKTEAQNQALQEAMNREYEHAKALEKKGAIAKENNKIIQESEAILKDEKSTTEERKKAEEDLNKAKGENASIMSEIQTKYKSLLPLVKQEENGILDVTKAIAEQNKQMRINLALKQQEKGNLVQETLGENISDMTTELGEYYASVAEYKAKAVELITVLQSRLKIGEIEQEEFDKYVKYLEAIDQWEGEIEKRPNFIDFGFSTAPFMDLGQLGAKVWQQWNGELFTKGVEDAWDDLEDNLDKSYSSIYMKLKDAFDKGGKDGAKAAAKSLNEWMDEHAIDDEWLRQRIKTWAETTYKGQITFDWNFEGPSDKTWEDIEDDTKKQLYKLLTNINDEGNEIHIPVVLDDFLGNEKTMKELVEKYGTMVQSGEKETNETQQRYQLPGQAAITYQQEQEAKKQQQAALKALRFMALGTKRDKNKSRRGGRNDIVGQYRDMLEIITTLNEDFKKFNEYLGANAAKQQVVAIYADKVKEIYKKLGWTIDDIDFTTVDGTVKAMEELLKKAKEVKGLDSFVGDLTIRIAKFKADAGQEDLAKAFEKVQEQVEGFFDDYEIYMELEEMGVPKDFAASLFGLDALSLEDVKKKLKELKEAGHFDGKKEEEAYEEYLRKIEKMEQEHLEKLLKDYVKYSLGTVSERAKIQLKYYRDIERINAATENNPQARAAIMEGLSKEYRADIQKNEWEELQETDFFIRIFGDLQNASKSAIEKMINDLEKYKKTWTDLHIDQIEELAKKLEELREAQAQLEAKESPWGAYREARKAIRKDGRTREEAEMDMAASEEKILGYEQQISSLEAIRSLLQQGKDAQAQINEFNEKYGTNIQANVDSVELLVAELKSGVANERSIVEAVIKLLRYYRQADNALEERINALGKIKQMASDLHGAFSELHEALGGDSESPAAIFAEMGTNITTGIISIGEMVVSFKKAQEGAKGLEKAMNTAMGIVGWIVQGIQIISSIITAIATNKDNQIKKKIEETKKEVEKLQKEFEKLEEAIEKAFTANDLQRQFRDGIANINEQIQKQEELIALEESRKKSKRDQSAIDDAKEEIEELQEKRNEILQSTVEDLGGTYDIRGAAREFVDAWVDAFRETGNGLKGLEDNFKVFFENILFEQAVMTGAGAIMKPLLDEITAALEDDYLLDEKETKDIQKLSKDQLGKLNTFMESFYSMYPEIFDAASELSGLSAGIEGITENQADVISSYLNTIRFFVASIDAKTSELIALQGGATQQNDANPMLAQLQIVAQQTTAINELLSSLTAKHPTLSGRGLKVII